MASAHFRILGRPATQGSKDQFGRESCTRLALWRADARLTATRNTPEGWQKNVPVQVSASFVFARPKSHYGRRKGVPYLKDSAPRYCTIRADVDKMARALCDAITGPLLVDDSQVVILAVRKDWSDDGFEWAAVTVTMLSLT